MILSHSMAAGVLLALCLLCLACEVNGTRALDAFYLRPGLFVMAVAIFGYVFGLYIWAAGGMRYAT